MPTDDARPDPLRGAAEEAHLWGPDHQRVPFDECSYEPCRQRRAALAASGATLDDTADLIVRRLYNNGHIEEGEQQDARDTVATALRSIGWSACLSEPTP